MKNAVAWLAILFAISLADLLSAQETTNPAAAPQTKLAEPKVTLVEAGELPRKVLRYSAVKDSDTTFSLTYQETTEEGGLAKTSSPAITSVINMHVLEVQPNGDMSCVLTITDVSEANRPDDVASKLRDALNPVIGLKIKSTITNRGFVKMFEVDTLPDASDLVKAFCNLIRNSLRRFVAPTPEEAVGVGGQWKAQTDLASNITKLSEESTITLEKFEGDLLTLQMAFVQTEPPRDLPSNLPNVKLRLLYSKYSFKGQMNLRLDNPFPVDSKNRELSERLIDNSIDGQNMPIIQHITATRMLKKIEPPVAPPVPVEPATPTVPPGAK